MIDIFAEVDGPINFDEWSAIASLQYDVGGEALIKILEARIRAAVTQLVSIPPSDIGAVAQLQSRINEAGVLRDFLKLDPSTVEAQRKAAEAPQEKE